MRLRLVAHRETILELECFSYEWKADPEFIRHDNLYARALSLSANGTPIFKNSQHEPDQRKSPKKL